MMYDVISHMTILSPFYCLPFKQYQKLCKAAIESRHRGKGVTGALQARSQVSHVIT